jgi:hypothetical protein
VEYYTPHDLASKDDNKIVYGMFDKINSFDKKELKLHYVAHSAPLAVKDFRRDIEVSQLGANIAIEEHYDLHHFGAGYVFYLCGYVLDFISFIKVERTL